MKKFACIICAAVLLILTLTGCLDIGGSFKPGSFGKTPREEAMVEALAEKYGDLTERGEPHFLEARMTSRIEQFIPVDTVTKYAEDSAKLYAWFVYDNFDNDDIEVEWIFTDDNHSIHTFKAKTGEKLGRGAFILERPDDGWALGNYKVSIRGRGLEEILTFEIIEGETVSTPLDFENGKIKLSTVPGWYFTHWEYVINESDITLVGGIEGSTIHGDKLLSYYEGTGDKNDFSVKVWRTLANGDPVASGSAVTKWTDPPVYFSGTDTPEFTVDRVVKSDWGIAQFSAIFDLDTIDPGYGTSGLIRFATPDGETHVQTYQGTFRMQNAREGREGDKRAIILYLNAYGFKYYYEWRE